MFSYCRIFYTCVLFSNCYVLHYLCITNSSFSFWAAVWAAWRQTAFYCSSTTNPCWWITYKPFSDNIFLVFRKTLAFYSTVGKNSELILSCLYPWLWQFWLCNRDVIKHGPSYFNAYLSPVDWSLLNQHSNLPSWDMVHHVLPSNCYSFPPNGYKSSLLWLNITEQFMTTLAACSKLLSSCGNVMLKIFHHFIFLKQNHFMML